MNGGGEKRWLKKGIAKLRSCQTSAGYLSSCAQASEQYGCLDFSMANIRRTNFLVAWEIATL
ncbi:hypothetical protein AGATL06_25350 [Agathobaculum sp. TL06]